MRINPNMLPSFSDELPDVPPMTAAQLRREALAIHRELYATHAQWLQTGDPAVLARQTRLSMVLERVLHQAEMARRPQ